MNATPKRGAPSREPQQLDAIVAELLAHESLDESEVYAAAGIERAAVMPSPTRTPRSSHRLSHLRLLTHDDP